MRTALAIILTALLGAGAYISYSRVPREMTVNNAYAKATVFLASMPNKTVRILLVPGHDNIDFGTAYRGLREADLNAELAGYLYEYLKKDPAFTVMTVRDFSTGEYLPVFENYFTNEAEEIKQFKNNLREDMAKRLQSGELKQNVTIDHNAATARTVHRLYGINKWANENAVDLVLHIHFNDYARSKRSRPGVYSGFSMYIPERQYAHAKESAKAAERIFAALKNHSPSSNLSLEQDGIIESQELIAVGANNSRLDSSVLIEYGYIYEPQFVEEMLRHTTLRELAFQTYRGLADHYGSRKIKEYDFKSSLLPFPFTEPVSLKTNFDSYILSMQAAMREEGLFPPDKKSLRDCPMTGSMSECLKRSILLFAEKYRGEVAAGGLDLKRGEVASSTLRKLNSIYAPR